MMDSTVTRQSWYFPSPSFIGVGRSARVASFPESLTYLEDTDQVPPKRPKRSWIAKFRDAYRGLKLGVRGHSSFFVHFFFSALVLVAAVILRCDTEQWCLLLLCIGLVLTAELFNSALETLFRGLDKSTKEKTWRSLDISAGAVLLASVVAIVIGAAVFLNQLVGLLE
jgi:diacylglycerol kinase